MGALSLLRCGLKSRPSAELTQSSSVNYRDHKTGLGTGTGQWTGGKHIDIEVVPQKSSLGTARSGLGPARELVPGSEGHNPTGEQGQVRQQQYCPCVTKPLDKLVRQQRCVLTSDQEQ